MAENAASTRDDAYQNALLAYATAESANLNALIAGLHKTKTQERVRDLRKSISIAKLLANTLQRLK